MKKDINKKYKAEIEFVKKTLNSVDEQPENAPSIAEIRKLVRTEVAKKEQKQQRAFYCFATGAFVTISVLIALIIKDPSLFIKIQLCSFIALPVAVFKFGKKVGTS